MRRLLWTLLALLACVSGEYLMGGHLDNNAGSKTRSGKIESSSTSRREIRLDDLDLDLVAAESTVAAVAAAGATEISTGDDGDVPRYHIPYPFAFNGGKPFSLEKDPITGKIDFEKAPPVKALNYTGRYREQEDKGSKDDDAGTKDGNGEESAYARQEKIRSKDGHDVSPNEINAYTPNFHDFLNLPVHYSSDKYGNDKYPLISSSYANTKVQSGGTSYSTYNHRPHHPENDLYVRPVKNPYPPMTKTTTYRTTTVNDLKAKWTSTTSPSTTTSASPVTKNSSHIVLSTSTKAPIVTTWKPSSTPIAFHSIRTDENEKNLLPIEKLHASSYAESHRTPSDVPARSPSDGATEKVATRYKDQPNLNLVLSHARPETKPQNEEYKDSYDTYESDSEGDSEENNYFLSFEDLLKEDVTSAPSTTTSSTTISTTTASTTTMVTASSAETTVAPSRSVSSTLPPFQEDVSTNKPLQFPTMLQHPSSSSHDRRPGITERYDGIISHGYRPSPIKSESDRIGPGVVVESTSNIVIPPDQDTVSFVLGNRQNVDGGYYSVGTAVGENPYGSLSETDALFWSLRNDPHDSTKEVKHEHFPVTELNADRVTQKWWSPTSSPLKSSNEVDLMRPQSPLVTATGTVVHDTKNPSKEKDSSYIIFPDDETKNKNVLTEEHIVIINGADGSIRELPPKTTLTATLMATNKTKLNIADDVIGDLPQLAEDLLPPAESSRPTSHYYHHQFDTPRPNHSRPQRLPPRIKPGLSVPPLDAGIRKRPYSPDTKLPNILPQFRPNAKASHGHRGPDVIGTMPAGQGVPTRIRQPLPPHPSRRPLPPPPSYLQRLNPPPPPIHAVRLAFTPTSKVDSVILPHETEPTIRRLRPPHGVPSISRGGPEESAPSNRLLAHGGNGEGGESRKEDRDKSEIVDERESEGSERYPEEPPMTPPRPPLYPKRRTADPPRVATLQMIQHHGEFGDKVDDAQLAQPAEPMLAHEAERRKSDNHDPSEIPEQPVYVVYPVNTAVNIHPDDSNEKDGSVVVGTRGPQRPLPPDTLLQNEQDDTHTVYNGRPIALDFPYPLERPDPSSVFSGMKETPVLIPNEQRQQQQQQQQQQQAAIMNERENEKNDAVNVIPYLQDFLPYRKKNEAAISVTLHRTAPIATSTSTASMSTSTPIAYVYTPTDAPYPAHLLEALDDDTVSNIDPKQTVLLPSQQPSSSSSSAPAPQNFMAPFVASISAEAPSKNGWSVVVVEPPAGAERKSDSDSDDAKATDSENSDTQTERTEFDADNFKPQLFGGFKPLYEFPTEDMEHHDVADTDTEINMPRHSKELLPVPDKK